MALVARTFEDVEGAIGNAISINAEQRFSLVWIFANLKQQSERYYKENRIFSLSRYKRSTGATSWKTARGRTWRRCAPSSWTLSRNSQVLGPDSFRLVRRKRVYELSQSIHNQVSVIPIVGACERTS